MVEQRHPIDYPRYSTNFGAYLDKDFGCQRIQILAISDRASQDHLANDWYLLQSESLKLAVELGTAVSSRNKQYDNLHRRGAPLQHLALYLLLPNINIIPRYRKHSHRLRLIVMLQQHLFHHGYEVFCV